MRLRTRNTLDFAIVALLAATMCTAGEAQQTANAKTKHSIARQLTLKGVPNFGEVTSTLYRGGQPRKEGFDNLAKTGISIVVDLRASHKGEREEVTRLGMQYVAIPWHCFHPQDVAFAKFLTLLRENAGKKVFVHCRLGHDRTGMMIAAYRMAEQGWTAKEAMKEMEAYGFSFAYGMICPGLSSNKRTSLRNSRRALPSRTFVLPSTPPNHGGSAITPIEPESETARGPQHSDFPLKIGPVAPLEFRASTGPRTGNSEGKVVLPVKQIISKLREPSRKPKSTPTAVASVRSADSLVTLHGASHLGQAGAKDAAPTGHFLGLLYSLSPVRQRKMAVQEIPNCRPARPATG